MRIRMWKSGSLEPRKAIENPLGFIAPVVVFHITAACPISSLQQSADFDFLSDTPKNARKSQRSARRQSSTGQLNRCSNFLDFDY
jgi:hypothetical protein